MSQVTRERESSALRVPRRRPEGRQRRRSSRSARRSSAWGCTSTPSGRFGRARAGSPIRAPDAAGAAAPRAGAGHRPPRVATHGTRRGAERAGHASGRAERTAMRGGRHHAAPARRDLEGRPGAKGLDPTRWSAMSFRVFNRKPDGTESVATAASIRTVRVPIVLPMRVQDWGDLHHFHQTELFHDRAGPWRRYDTPPNAAAGEHNGKDRRRSGRMVPGGDDDDVLCALSKQHASHEMRFVNGITNSCATGR